MNLILASGSPRRKELLEHMGLRDFQIRPTHADEHLTPGLSPALQVEELSLRKAQAAAEQAGSADLILAADTVVALHGTILGKPSCEEDARRMLTALSGNCHQVYTGVTLLQGGQCLTRHQETSVQFRSLLPEEIRQYIATGECMDKAGAYGIQGFGALLIDRIEGDYYNVVGLPVSLLASMLRQFGVDCLRLAAGGNT